MNSELRLPSDITKKVSEGYTPYPSKLLHSSQELLESESISQTVISRIQYRIQLLETILSTDDSILQKYDNAIKSKLLIVKNELMSKLDSFPITLPFLPQLQLGIAGDKSLESPDIFSNTPGNAPEEYMRFLGKEFIIQGVQVKIIGHIFYNYKGTNAGSVKIVINQVTLNMRHGIFLGFKKFLEGEGREGVYLNADQKTGLKILLSNNNLLAFYLKLKDLMLIKKSGVRVE